ncbi:MAG TPA: hypothetical protein PJ991_01835 [Kiritimatiellia bacterium]|nr:hypothetical protein [Kiritimatiellia bacterium]
MIIAVAGCIITTALWLQARRELKAIHGARIVAEAESMTHDVLNGIKTPSMEEEPQIGAPLHDFRSMIVPPDRVIMRETAQHDDAELPPMTEALASALSRFDAVMDREFDRLDQREKTSLDGRERATIQLIKEKLAELDELYREADNAQSREDRSVLREKMQTTMGQIIGLTRRDRNERLTELANRVGLSQPDEVKAFMDELDRVYRETHMDWTKLFNRAPPNP